MCARDDEPALTVPRWDRGELAMIAPHVGRVQNPELDPLVDDAQPHAPAMDGLQVDAPLLWRVLLHLDVWIAHDLILPGTSPSAARPGSSPHRRAAAAPA